MVIGRSGLEGTGEGPTLSRMEPLARGYAALKSDGRDSHRGPLTPRPWLFHPTKRLFKPRDAGNAAVAECQVFSLPPSFLTAQDPRAGAVGPSAWGPSPQASAPRQPQPSSHVIGHGHVSSLFSLQSPFPNLFPPPSLPPSQYPRPLPR